MSNAVALPSLPLEWHPVPQSLPPDPEGGWFSPDVWLALSDGRVVQGNCLHRSEDATYDAPVHAWFEGRCQLPESIKVIAWMPFATPDFPAHLRHLAIKSSTKRRAALPSPSQGVQP